MIPFPSPEEDSSLDSAEISAQIEAIRPALRGYILSILPHPDAVEDVVQETCLFLWERRADFQAGTNFKAWAFKTGYFKALAHRRALQRNKIITFSEDVLHRIAGAAEQQAGHADARLSALSHCLRELGPADLRLLRLRYVEQASLASQARELGHKPNRLQKAISRIRLALRHCIEKRISETS